MRVIKKVVQIGSSLGIILDKVIIESLDIKLGEEVIVDIIKDFRKLKNESKS